MADHPEAEQITTGDRTSALVAGGLTVLAVLGVVTIFSDVIAAAWSPAAAGPSASASAPASAPASSSAATPAAPTAPAPAADDGGPA